MKVISLTDPEMNKLRETGEIVRIYNREVSRFKTIEPIDCFVHLSCGIYMGQLIAKQQPPEDGYPDGCAYVYVLTSKRLMLPDGSPLGPCRDDRTQSAYQSGTESKCPPLQS